MGKGCTKDIYCFDDNITASFIPRKYSDGSEGVWLVVRRDEKELLKLSWLARHEAKGIEAVVRDAIKSYDDSLKIFNELKCPRCGTDLVDNEGRHKGHGSIYCPECKKALVWI